MDDLRRHIEQLREDFAKGTLSEADVSKDPSAQFNTWLAQAVEAAVPEVQAMNLATVSADLKPASRIVYLREFGNNRYSFYTNYQSRKAQELAANNYAALTFFWPELERQVRIEGIVERSPASQSDAYYNSRPYDSKIGAWASKQSKHLTSREELEKKINNYKMMFSAESIVRPDFWGGYTLEAGYYEFWQGRKSRLHDRIVYTRGNEGWSISRLSP